jgi:hypothetical protein
MSEPSDIESCNEKTILDKVNDHIDGILNKTSYSLWSHVKSRDIRKVVDIPVIFYFSGVHEDYHKPGDDAPKILYNKMETISRLVFHTAWNVANRDERLKVDVTSDFKNE